MEVTMLLHPHNGRPRFGYGRLLSSVSVALLLMLLLVYLPTHVSATSFTMAGLLSTNITDRDVFVLVQPLAYSYWAAAANPQANNYPVSYAYSALDGAEQYAVELVLMEPIAVVGGTSLDQLQQTLTVMTETPLFGTFQQQFSTLYSFNAHFFNTANANIAEVLYTLWVQTNSNRFPRQVAYYRLLDTANSPTGLPPLQAEAANLGCNTVQYITSAAPTAQDTTTLLATNPTFLYFGGIEDSAVSDAFAEAVFTSANLQKLNTTVYTSFALMPDMLRNYGANDRAVPRGNIFATSPVPSFSQSSYPIVQGFTNEINSVQNAFLQSKPTYQRTIALAGWVTAHVAMQSVLQYSGPTSNSSADVYNAMNSMQSTYMVYETFYGTFAGAVSADAQSQGAISSSSYAGNAIYLNQMTGPTALAPNGDFVGVPNSEFIYGLGQNLQLTDASFLSTITLYATAYAVGVSLTDDPVTAYVCDQASVATGVVQRSSLGKVSNHGYRGRCVSSTTAGMTAALAADAATYVTTNLVIGVLPDGLDTSTSFVVDPIPASPSLRVASANTVYLFATLEQQLYVTAIYASMIQKSIKGDMCGVVRGPQSSAILDLMNLTMASMGFPMSQNNLIVVEAGKNMVTLIPSGCGFVLTAGILGTEVSALQAFLHTHRAAYAFVDFDALTMNYPNFVTSFGTNAASTRLLFATNLPSWSPATASTAPSDARQFISAAGANYNTPAALRQMYVSLLIDQLTNNGNTQALPTNLQANFDKIDTAISLGGVSFGPFNTQGCLSVSGSSEPDDCLVNMGARNLYVWSLGNVLAPGGGPLTVPTTPSMIYDAQYDVSGSGLGVAQHVAAVTGGGCRHSSDSSSHTTRTILDIVALVLLVMLLLLILVIGFLWKSDRLQEMTTTPVASLGIAQGFSGAASLYKAATAPSTKDELSRCDAVTVATVDVAASVALWSTVPRAMSAATLACRRAVRAAAVRHGCYEVRHVGDVFVFACRDTLCALAFAADVQRDAGRELKSCVREEVAASYERLRSVRGDAGSVKPPAPTPASGCLLLRVGVHAGTRTPNEDLCASCLRLADVALRASHLSRCGGVVATSIAADDVHEDAGLVSQGRYNLSDDEHVEVFSTTPLCISGEDLESEPVMFPHGLRLLEEGRECRPKGMIDVVRQIVRGINMSSCSRTRNSLLEHTCESFALTGTVQREDCPVPIFSVLQEGQLSELVAQRVAAVLERCGLRPIVEREVDTLEAMELVEGDGMHTREVVERGLLLADGRRAVFTRVERQERVGCRPTKAMTTAEGLAAENPLVPSTMRGREGAEGEPVAAQEGLMEGSMGSPMSFALSPGFGFGTGAGMVNVGRCDSRNISRAACNSVELPEDAAADAGDDAEWTQNDLDTDASLNVRYNRLLHSSRFAASSRPEMAREEGEEVEQAEQQQLASARGGGRRPSRVVAAEDGADSPVDESSINEDLDGTQSRRHRHSRRHGDNDTSITDHLRSRTMLSTFLTPEEVNYRHGRPTFDGDRITPCFKQDNGLLFRMVNTETGQWAYYNDTTKYMMHIHFLAGRASKLVALGDTRMECPSEHHRRYEGELWVAPLATELLFAGSINGYDVKYRAVPVKRLR